jgi:signal transduction histidine kinase
LNLDILLTDCLSSEDQSTIRDIQTAVDRANSLIRQMLSLRKESLPNLENISLARLIHEDLHFIKGKAKTRNITISLDFSDDGFIIPADSTQIRQVILNLCINAVQAMMEKGGTLTIGLSNRTIPENNPSPAVSVLSPGNYVILTISDTGEGMNPEVKARIFEPLFTTRLDGTGLGMSIVQSIVEKHSGLVVLDSIPGKGTTFEVLFPGVTES